VEDEKADGRPAVKGNWEEVSERRGNADDKLDENEEDIAKQMGKTMGKTTGKTTKEEMAQEKDRHENGTTGLREGEHGSPILKIIRLRLREEGQRLAHKRYATKSRAASKS
jgi:hypothetical protein